MLYALLSIRFCCASRARRVRSTYLPWNHFGSWLPTTGHRFPNLFWSVLFSSGLFWSLRIPSGLFWSLLWTAHGFRQWDIGFRISSGLFRSFVVSSVLIWSLPCPFWSLQISSVFFWSLLDSSGLFWSFLFSSTLFLSLLVSSGLFWSLLVSSGLFWSLLGIDEKALVLQSRV